MECYLEIVKLHSASIDLNAFKPCIHFFSNFNHAAGCVISLMMDDGVDEGDNSCDDGSRGIGSGSDGTAWWQ